MLSSRRDIILSTVVAMDSGTVQPTATPIQLSSLPVLLSSSLETVSDSCQPISQTAPDRQLKKEQHEEVFTIQIKDAVSFL